MYYIKISICINIDSLKKRYATYYGSNFRYYYVEVDDKTYENDVHEELKN
jgi:hypothetical protein